MLLTVTKLQKTGANKLEVGSYGKTRKKKSYTASVNSSCTGATEALQQFQPTKNFIRSNSIEPLQKFEANMALRRTNC